MNLSIRTLAVSDIPTIVDAFEKAHWPKSPSLFESYLEEQEQKQRIIWIVQANDQLAGYVTLLWISQYAPFAECGIPEIMDLNVLPPFRNQGVASKLLEVAEKEAATKSDEIGLGVGLYGGPDGGYGAAQRLYVNRGYVHDGKGVTYNYSPARPWAPFPLDDNLVLWFTKKLNKKHPNFEH